MHEARMYNLRHCVRYRQENVATTFNNDMQNLTQQWWFSYVTHIPKHTTVVVQLRYTHSKP
jgi:hypothetical protein